MGWICLRRWLLAACLLVGEVARGEHPNEVIPRDDTKFLIEEHQKARDRVDEVFDAGVDLSSLMCSPPSQVAFTEKSKHIRIPDSMDPTDINLGRYRDAGVPIFDSCQIWISDKWEFVYILQPKSSAKMVMRAVRKDICKKAACLPEEFRLLDFEDIGSLPDLLRRYYVFTFVRNPWTRALSTYSMFHKDFLFQKPDGPGAEHELIPTERCGVTFDDFARDVGTLLDACEHGDCCTFVPARGTWWPEFVNIHVGDHSHCMFLPNGEPLVDYVGLTEFFDAAWVDIMNTLLLRFNGTRRLADAAFDEPRHSTYAAAPAAGGPGEGQVTIWHAVPQVGAAAAGGVQAVAYVTQSAQADELTHACNSSRTMAFLNETTARSLARQYALDLVRLGYI
eukprot:jgi/Ulvmu1/12215/UM086_0004.1